MNRRSYWLFLLILPLFPVLWGLGTFLYPRFSSYSDLTISHLPNAIYILQAIREFGRVPLWSDFLMGGYPFSADPLAGLWYPPNWIAILIPAPWGFNILSALHLFWAGLGMIVFLSISGLKREAAIFGGIAYAAMPKTFAHLLIGHISLVYAMAWLPWLLSAEAYLKNSLSKRTIFRLLPGVILGIIALADVRAAFYAGALYFFYWFWKRILSDSIERNWKVFIAKAAIFLERVSLGLAVSAVLLLPLIQLIALSTRTTLSAADSLVFSLPLNKILNLFVPDFGGYAEWVVYPGAAVVFLIILVLATKNLRKQTSFWLVVIALSLLLSFGSNLPFMVWIGSTPIASLMRVPARWMFIGGFGMVVVASYAFNELVSGYKKPKFDPIFWMVALCAFFVVFIIGSLILKAKVGLNLFWAITGLLLATVLIALTERGLISRKATTFLFSTLLLIDLVGVNLQSVQYKDANSIYEDGRQIVEQLQNGSDYFRVYSPDYAIPQLTAIQSDIEMVSAINPLQLASFSAWMSVASGIPVQEYSVAAPPLDGINLENSNRASQINGEALGLLNVKYIVANYSIENPDLVEKWSDSNTWIYENTLVMPRAWVELESTSAQSNFIPANIISNQPGKIVVEAEGPGNLILSETDFPGWTVKIDQKDASIFRVADIIMGVYLESGNHQVEFVYRPALQYIGIAISILAWIFFGIVIAIRRRQ